jgi:predicted deacylase
MRHWITSFLLLLTGRDYDECAAAPQVWIAPAVSLTRRLQHFHDLGCCHYPHAGIGRAAMSGTSRSRIAAEVDFTRNGRQNGYLRLFHSVHSSAYGFIPIPIVVLKNGDGPTALLVSGTHGDEYEGQVALCNLAKSLDPARIKGRVIILPAANFPAAVAGRRTSPIDEGNLNRLFPGDPDGTVTQQIAYHIEHELVPLADLVCDLHSGGSSLMYVPAALMGGYAREGDNSKGLAALKAFASPLSYVIEANQGGDRTLSGGAIRQGVLALGTELGGSGHVTRAAVRIAERGVNNLLVHLGILPDDERIALDGPQRFLEVGGSEYYTYAPDNGLYEPLVDLGDMIRAGQPAARIHFPETPWAEPVTAHFTRDGFVLCKRIPGRTMRGDCLFHLGTDIAI